MIKNLYMKAFSFLLIMFIGMIYMTGFGQSTADLKENPKQEQVVMQVTSLDTASVEVMTLYAAYDGVMVTDQGNTYYTVYRNESGDCEVVMFSTEIDVSPPLITNFNENSTTFNFRQSQSNPLNFDALSFRKPRDGISCSC